MSRSGYSDDCENLWLWRGAVARAIRGKRGQAMLRDLLAALEAMPVKRLITEELEADGNYCTLGVLGKARNLPMAGYDSYDFGYLAHEFGVARALIQEIEFENDEGTYRPETPEQRWQRMRAWVAEQIKQETP